MSHVRVAVYDLTSGTAKEAADLAQEGMLGVFRGQPGFQAYGLAETQEGKMVSVSLWESAEQAQQANELAASWVKENLADRVRLESGQVGDFLFYETA
jgi:heme-degrading monooxygenase HmoA